MRGYEAIAAELARLGVRDAFTFMAKDVCLLVAAMSAQGIRVHHARHETVAIGMADGYARASGRVGVAVVGQGVGLTNGINALVTAVKGHSRLLVLAGEVPGGGGEASRLQRKHIDQLGLLDLLEIAHADLRSVASVRADLARCVDVAQRSGEPLVVNLPDDVLEGEAGDAPLRLALDAPVRRAPGAGDLATLVELLEDPLLARRTVVLAGRGAVEAEARPHLLRIGEATGALLGTTLMAKALFAGERYGVGIVGTYSTPVASELLHQADLVLAFGASLSYETTYNGSIFGKARIVQIDHRRTALSAFQRADLEVEADAGLTAAAIADALERHRHRAAGYRGGDTAQRIAGEHVTFTDRSGPRGLDQRTLLTALDRLLPRERTVVVDGGNQAFYGNTYLSVPDPRGFIWPVGYTALGCGLGCALGAAVARPERLSVLSVGDAGTMLALADLHTAVRYRLPIVLIVHNNASLLSEVHHLRDHGFSGDDARYPNPSFEAVAKSLGLEAATITEIGDLDALAPRLAGLNGPLLLDCRTTDEEIKTKIPNYARDRSLTVSRG